MRMIISALFSVAFVGSAFACELTGNDQLLGYVELYGAGCSVDMSDAMSKQAALAAALSQPVWLEAGENGAISGGFGFNENDAAFGVTGVMRIGKNLAGYAGGAVDVDGADDWVGKAGLRAGW